MGNLHIWISIINEGMGTYTAQIRAARALLRWSAAELAKEASLGANTIRRAEVEEGHDASHGRKSSSPSADALEAAGVEFIDENGGGAGVRLRKPVGGKSGK